MITLFQDVLQDNYYSCGGKGKSLVEMVKAGFQIPKGFIIHSEEFLEYYYYNHLENTPIDMMQNSILNGSFPQGMKERIVSVFEKVFCANELVAVRSSALCEDSKEFAWSGELETYLFVDKESLLECIKKCYSSLFSERALAYASRTNIRSEEQQVAVIVQQQIDSEFAGVAFSNNPVTGKDELTIEAVNGQGENLVSGKENPDRYIVSYKNDFLRVQFSDSPIHLSDSHLLAIAANVKKLKEYYKYPVDVEWAIQNNHLYILQCRPITTITHENKIQNTVIQLFPTSRWEFDTQGEFNYVIMRTIMNAANPKVQEAVFGFHREIEDCLRFNGQIYKSIESKRYLSQFISSKLSENPDFLCHFANKWNNVATREDNYIQYLKSRNWQAVSTDRLAAETQRFEQEYTYSLVYVYFYLEGYLEERLLRLIKQNHNYPDNLCNKIVQSLASCDNNLGTLLYSEEPIDLLIIAKRKQQGFQVAELLEKHIEKYSWMLSPIGREFKVFEKKHYEQRINEQIAKGNLSDRLSSLVHSGEENDALFFETIKEYNLLSEEIRLAKIIRAFIFYRTLLTEKSDWLFFNGRINILREISRRINFPENDLVMLSLDEIGSLLENKISWQEAKSLAVGRSKHYALIYLQGELMSFEGQDALDIETEFIPAFLERQKSALQSKDNNMCIMGTPCYPGKIKGKVRIVKDISDCEKVKNGDILVANMTTPNFISAMERAGGFVTDQGGITCHAAILSREMKIPCIVGTSVATKLLHDGETVLLNCYSGTVQLVKSKDAE